MIIEKALVYDVELYCISVIITCHYMNTIQQHKLMCSNYHEHYHICKG